MPQALARRGGWNRQGLHLVACAGWCWQIWGVAGPGMTVWQTSQGGTLSVIITWGPGEAGRLLHQGISQVQSGGQHRGLRARVCFEEWQQSHRFCLVTQSGEPLLGGVLRIVHLSLPGFPLKIFRVPGCPHGGQRSEKNFETELTDQCGCCCLCDFWSAFSSFSNLSTVIVCVTCQNPGTWSWKRTRNQLSWALYLTKMETEAREN